MTEVQTLGETLAHIKSGFKKVPQRPFKKTGGGALQDLLGSHHMPTSCLRMAPF